MIKGRSGRFITGKLTGVQLCCVVEYDIKFLFGYVLQHCSNRYSKGNWFVTSYITDIEVVDGGYLFTTANSIYEIAEYETIEIPLAAMDNIRRGTPPRQSILLTGGGF